MLASLRLGSSNAASATSSLNGGRASVRRGASTLAQSRRKREKLNLQVKPDPLATWVSFPRERLGLNYDLNASLNVHHRLTPYGEAFRNLYTRHLLMLSNGKLDANKALVTETEAKETTLYYVTPEINPAFTPSGSHAVVPDATFRKLGRVITDHIGESENVFVLDAAVGSHRLGEVNVRVITNSANVNLYLKHMMPRQGHNDLATFQYEWTVYVAPDLELADLKSLGLKSSSFAIANLERAILFIAGSPSNQAIKEAITAAVSSRSLQDAFPSLGLSSASVVQKNGKSALVIDPSNQLGQLHLSEVPAASKSTSKSSAPMAKAEEAAKASKGKKKAEAAAEATQKALFTAQLSDGVVGLGGAFWNHYGVFRMFQGITHNNEKVPRQRADLVEQVKSNGKVVASNITQPLKDLPNESPAPAALVFLINDQNALLPQVAKMSLAQASKFLSVGYTGIQDNLLPFFQARPIVAQPGQIDKLFQELSATGNTKAFVVNTQRKDGSTLTSEEIDQIIASATDGSLASAPSTTDTVFKYDVISQVKGVKGSLDITQGWEKKDYASRASKLASLLSA